MVKDGSSLYVYSAEGDAAEIDSPDAAGDLLESDALRTE